MVRVATSLSDTHIGTAMLAFPHRPAPMDGSMWRVAMVLWETVVALPMPHSQTDSARARSGADTSRRSLRSAAKARMARHLGPTNLATKSLPPGPASRVL